MGKWSREEIDDGFQHFMDVTDRCFLFPTNDPRVDLEEWLMCFTEDVTYRDYGSGFSEDGSVVEIQGRDAVREWICHVFESEVARAMKYYPVPWYVIDEERGWAICEWMTTLEDPGDGSLHSAKCYSRLKYAGSKQWSFEEDIQNPQRIHEAMNAWMQAKARCSGKDVQ